MALPLVPALIRVATQANKEKRRTFASPPLVGCRIHTFDLRWLGPDKTMTPSSPGSTRRSLARPKNSVLNRLFFASAADARVKPGHADFGLVH
jgi:hypothetical protein